MRLPLGRLGLLAVVALLGVSVVAGVGLAQTGVPTSPYAEGEPDINLYVPDNEVTPGTQTQLTVQLDNEGELDRGKEQDRALVTTARSVVVDMDAGDTPITVNTRARSYGTLTENEPREAVFGIEVPTDAEPGTYEVDVELEYDFTSRVVQRPGIVNDQTQRSRSVTKTIEIEVSDDARFRVTDVESTLRVGEEGAITGNLTNIGGEDATNAELSFTPTSASVVALETAVAVGDVPAGESVPFRLPVEVGSEARAVPKRFDLPVSFRDPNGISQVDENPQFIADIGQQRDEFDIRAVNRSLPAGSSQPLEFEVTNNRAERVTDVEAQLFTDSPLDSSDDEAYVESLDPGESTTVVFELSADSGATPKTRPVSVDFRYDDERGRSQLSDSYRVPIDITEAEDDGLPLGLIAVVGLVVVGAGAFLWRRRSAEDRGE